MKHYDLFVIGSGPAGHHGALQAAKLGKSVAIAEKQSEIGGACVHRGTIPSKALRETVLYLSGFRQRGFYGKSYRAKQQITPDDLVSRVKHVIDNEADVYRAHFQRNSIDLLTGRASFVDTHTVRVDHGGDIVDYSADFILVSAGASPLRTDKIPVDGTTIFDSDMLPSLEFLPKTLTVIGGGVIGLEYACLMATLGVEVTVVEKRPRVLSFADSEITEALSYHMRNIGVVFRLGEEVERVEKAPTGKVVAQLVSKKKIFSDALFCAFGRQGNTAGLSLEAAGLEADKRGRLKVNENYQTSVTHIYAAGDIIGFPSLASVAFEQGRLAAAHAFNLPAKSVPELFPYGIYTIPEISFVGKTEEELTDEEVPYEVGISRHREIARGQIIGTDVGLLKLLVHRETRRLLGVHILGEGATDLVHIGQMVMALDGTVDTFVNTVFNYPTLAECYKVAALDVLNKLIEARLAYDVPTTI